MTPPIFLTVGNNVYVAKNTYKPEDTIWFIYHMHFIYIYNIYIHTHLICLFNPPFLVSYAADSCHSA